MIFAVNNHIEQIIKGIKTQTRRVAKPNSFFYKIGSDYGIRPCRTCCNIPNGRIKILDIKLELKQDQISVIDAKAEGNYTPENFEVLFEKINPKWQSRYAYTFKFMGVKKS